MAERPRILITGSQGFIGTALRHALGRERYDVWGLDCSGSNDDRVLQVDLLDLANTRRSIQACQPFSVLIHTAALAHGQRIDRAYSYSWINLEMTENVLNAVRCLDVRFVFLSSVAVYGEDNRRVSVSTDEQPRPATDYGESKLLCERAILRSGIEHCDILRLAPLYDESHMNDVRKRVYLPGPLKFKVRFWPSPSYSLCNIETLAGTMVRMLREPPSAHVIRNVADARPYGQNELLSWFPGKSLLLPLLMVQPLYYAMALLPRRIRYPCRCMYWKLFKSNVYQL